MKALTICQPHAQRIVYGAKRIENRNWPTSYRGSLAIHAGKSRAWLDAGDDPTGMAFGAVIGTCRLADCVRFDDLPDSEQKRTWGCGPWCWMLTDVRAIRPVPCNGHQMLWEWNGRGA